MEILHRGTNRMPITEITAFVSVDENGNEGIIGRQLGEKWVPFVYSNPELTAKAVPIVKEMMRQGVKVKILRFTNREDITEKFKLNG